MSLGLRLLTISVACDGDWRGLFGDRSARKNLTIAEALEVLND
jgi:hypothetical protein